MIFYALKKCDRCHGKGKKYNKVCVDCKGTGSVVDK